ncbi:hypothetical protein ALC53_10713 [Atta colombica]|uniref:Uncharacterized protein n=1 Tax=Atta colombica TaxID=520822 RepID=A0A151I0T5_9HYME|nr:hypothetical protein ALC53_10713 [Atta colombica]
MGGVSRHPAWGSLQPHATLEPSISREIYEFLVQRLLVATTRYTISIFGQVTMIKHFEIFYEQLNEKAAGDGPEGEGEGRREGGESRRRKLRHTGRVIYSGPAPSKGFHGEPVRYKHVGVFHGIQIRRPRASYS